MQAIRLNRTTLCLCGLVLLGVSIWLFSIFSGPYRKFCPIRLGPGPRNMLIPAPELLSASYVERIILVLEHYNQPYKIDEHGKLLITAQLSNDKELLWNYCTKSQDDIWMKDHVEELIKLRNRNANVSSSNETQSPRPLSIVP